MPSSSKKVNQTEAAHGFGNSLLIEFPFINQHQTVGGYIISTYK